MGWKGMVAWNRMVTWLVVAVVKFNCGWLRIGGIVEWMNGGWWLVVLEWWCGGLLVDLLC